MVRSLTLSTKATPSYYWASNGFSGAGQRLEHHWQKYAKALGKSKERYTQDALGFYSQYLQQGKLVVLQDRSLSLQIRIGQGQPGGSYTPDGKILSFWYRSI